MPDQQAILIIMTGGTIDAEPYSETPQFVTPKDKSQIPALVETLGYDASVCDFFQWKMKDSQEFTEDEIYDLAEIIRADGRETFIITHGTDAMIPNAKLLESALKNSGKTVFFVGAMEPLAHGAASDGPANLKCAIDTIKHHDQGVFIVGRSELKNGRIGPRIYTPDEVRKDKTRKLFVEVQPQQGLAL